MEYEFLTEKDFKKAGKLLEQLEIRSRIVKAAREKRKC